MFMACYPVTFNSVYVSVYVAGCVRMITNPALPHLSPFPLIGPLYALIYLPPPTT